MNIKKTGHFITAIVCLSIFLFSGCIRFYSYKQYPVRVVDPELNQPVEGASVSVNYFMVGGGLFIPNSPKAVITQTDATGSAKLKVATNPAMYVCSSQIEADGYISALGPIGFGGSRILKIGNEGEIIVPIYRKPVPKMAIIISDGYQGPVALHFIPTAEWIQGKPGQREFSYKVGQNGYLSIQVPPLFILGHLFNDISLHRVISPGNNDGTITVKRENGHKILRVGREYERAIQYAGREHEIEPGSIAFRWVGDEAPRMILFVIGTEQDRKALYEKIYPDDRHGLDHNAFHSYFQE